MVPIAERSATQAGRNDRNFIIADKAKKYT